MFFRRKINIAKLNNKKINEKLINSNLYRFYAASSPIYRRFQFQSFFLRLINFLFGQLSDSILHKIQTKETMRRDEDLVCHIAKQERYYKRRENRRGAKQCSLKTKKDQKPSIKTRRRRAGW